jgi:hypothetical protein
MMTLTGATVTQKMFPLHSWFLLPGWFDLTEIRAHGFACLLFISVCFAFLAHQPRVDGFHWEARCPPMFHADFLREI